MLYLPDDLIVHVLTFLPTGDILNISLVCKKLFDLSNHDLVWASLFFQEWHVHPGKIGREYFKSCLQVDERWFSGNYKDYKVSVVGQPLKSVHILGHRYHEDNENETTICVQTSTQIYFIAWELGEIVRKWSLPSFRGSMDCFNDVIANIGYNKEENLVQLTQIDYVEGLKTIACKSIPAPRGETCTSLGRNLLSLACSISDNIYFFKDISNDFEKIPSSSPCTIYDLQLGRKMLMKASNNSSIELIDLRTLKTVATLKGHKYSVNCARWHQIDADDGTYIVSGSADKQIKCWDMRKLEPVFSNWNDDAVLSIEFDSKKILSGTFDGKITQWNTATGEMLHVYDCENGVVSKNGSEKEYQYFVSSSSANVHGMIYTSMPVVEGLKFKNSLLVAACSDGKIRRWFV